MSEAATQTWSIVIACYNESGAIQQVIKNTRRVLDLISADQGEIIVVNDGSDDNSDEEIRALMQEAPYQDIIYIQHEVNKGIGEALHTGYQTASKENVILVPGDGQFDLEELIPFKNLDSKAILSFYRVENTTYTFSRNILSWFNKSLNKFFLGLELKDVNWVKAYKSKAVQALDLEIRSSLVESEICSKLIYLGYQPQEIKSKYLPRIAGVSKGASFNIVKQAILDIIRLIIVLQRFKRRQAKR